ncbi:MULTISPECIES: hypothetical protein [Calothrix]|uniref:Uncharacterized protein n=2 Tax=Calothrix TaxID=1186 RepID=A0ABR8A2R2_9CYAN|nr:MULTISPECIES: hypothetical protein [Calothrix]MBD2194176.1 hypothetical protein [Calothrix parietina FACHB-288]MBD2224972.1 hypothetical protein [Calothrix anomala FACHB-343]
MQSIKINSYVDKDGMLHLDIAVDVQESVGAGLAILSSMIEHICEPAPTACEKCARMG